jgi:hypothetical protein
MKWSLNLTESVYTISKRYEAQSEIDKLDKNFQSYICWKLIQKNGLPKEYITNIFPQRWRDFIENKKGSVSPLHTQLLLH